MATRPCQTWYRPFGIINAGINTLGMYTKRPRIDINIHQSWNAYFSLASQHDAVRAATQRGAGKVLRRAGTVQNANTSISPISPSGEAYKYDERSPNEAHAKRKKTMPTLSPTIRSSSIMNPEYTALRSFLIAWVYGSFETTSLTKTHEAGTLEGSV